MARRRIKKRTQPLAKNGPATSKNGASAMSRSPKSMVIRIGASEVGSSVSQLAKDFRLMMEPDTASRLKVSINYHQHISGEEYHY
jgi:ribosome biogenesis protein SSF1/2